MRTLNFGVLSTASVNGYAFLPIVKRLARVSLLAVASRDASKAAEYAADNGIRRSYGSYDELLADPDIHCVYIPLPVSMHAEWSIKALEAGKHVLCEKPVAANEAEAVRIAEKVDETGLIFAEALHHRYHPLMEEILNVVSSGAIGELRHVSSQLGVPLLDKSKVQFDPSLAGGALLDVGCYPATIIRWIAGGGDSEVVDAVAKEQNCVDVEMKASLLFAGGVSADFDCSLVRFMPSFAKIIGSEGSIFVAFPFSPVVEAGPVNIPVYIMVVKSGGKLRFVRVANRSTYHCQLVEFCRCVREGIQPLTSASESVLNMRLLDSIYEKSGLGIRCPKPEA